MKIVALLIITAFALMSCTNHSGQNTFDTNAAEMNEFPGDTGRRAGETNGEAAARSGTHDAGMFTHDEKVNGDAAFAAAAAEASLTEIDLGTLAASKTKNKKLTEFAERMVADHSLANLELTSLAEEKRLKVPSDCSGCVAAHRELHDMVDPEFSKRYADLMVADHEKAVALFEKESTDGSDPELKAWAKKMLPALQHHLEMAKELKAKNL
jgi:putative membrane protein